MKQRGFSLIELLVVMATIAVLMAIALPLFQDALLRANTSSLSTDARAFYVAVKQYYVDNNSFPETGGFDKVTFEPLVSLGYYSGRVASRLEGKKADGYLGTGDEFWLEMTLDVDPSVRFLVADSKNAPLGGGAYLDGVFLYVDGIAHEIGTTN